MRLTATRASVTSGGAALWTPANLSGLSLWLDADDASTITESSGSISQWDDKSGNGNHATQSTASNQPTYGTQTINAKNVVHFDGSEFMTTGYPPGLNRTLVAVVQYTSFAGLKVVAGARETLNQRSYFGTNSGVGRGAVAELTAVDGSSLSSNTTYTQILSHGQGAVNREAYYYLDGTEEASATFTGNIGSGVNYMIGGFNDGGTIHSSRFSGRIAEFVVTDNIISDSNRQKLEGYLAHKWDTTSSLPANHPYKSSAPTV